jgi:uncharacterized protein (TIGR00369 family)
LSFLGRSPGQELGYDLPVAEASFHSIVDEDVRGSIAGPALLGLPGIDRIRAITTGDVPLSPVQRLTGLRPTQVSYGSCTVVLPASPWLQTQTGFFLSGVTALAADFALGGAIMSALPAGIVPVTSDLNFTYLRPIRLDAQRLIAQGKLIEAGRNQATSETTVSDGNGRLLAHATTRCFLQQLEFDPDVKLPETAPEEYATPDPYARPLPETLTGIPDLGGLTGLEVFTRISKGDLPGPFTSLLGIDFDLDESTNDVLARFQATPWFNSPAGTIYGGMLAALADGLNTAAATTTLDAGTATATLDMKVHFLRPGIADGSTLQGRAEVMHNGKNLIVTRSEIDLASGKPLLIATGSFMRRAIRDWTPVVAP